jgi:hypothetical protein
MACFMGILDRCIPAQTEPCGLISQETSSTTQTTPSQINRRPLRRHPDIQHPRGRRPERRHADRLSRKFHRCGHSLRKLPRCRFLRLPVLFAGLGASIPAIVMRGRRGLASALGFPATPYRRRGGRPGLVKSAQASRSGQRQRQHQRHPRAYHGQHTGPDHSTGQPGTTAPGMAPFKRRDSAPGRRWGGIGSHPPGTIGPAACHRPRC